MTTGADAGLPQPAASARQPMDAVRPLDHREPVVARDLLALQQASYAVEARLIAFDGIPPLHESLGQLMAVDLCWLGAFEDDRLAGAVAYERAASLVDIARLIVAPWAFRRGHGLALMLAVLDREAPATFTVSTGTLNHPARQLYERMGFRVTGEVEVSPGVLVARYALSRLGS